MSEQIGNRVINLASVDSTNNYATKMVLNNNWHEGIVVVAHEQNAGKGLLTNTWESEPGKNLTCSILLSPTFLPIPLQFEISKITALAVWQIISLYTDNVKVKWPNDIYVGSKKIAGILIENSIMGNTLNSSIIGIGLNINQIEFKSNAPNPISLAQICSQNFEIEVILDLLLHQINDLYTLLREGNTEPIDNLYDKLLYQKSQWANYSDEYGPYEGKINGVNEIGQLIIERRNGQTSEYHFKEVSFL